MVRFFMVLLLSVVITVHADDTGMLSGQITLSSTVTCGTSVSIITGNILSATWASATPADAGPGTYTVSTDNPVDGIEIDVKPLGDTSCNLNGLQIGSVSGAPTSGDEAYSAPTSGRGRFVVIPLLSNVRLYSDLALLNSLGFVTAIAPDGYSAVWNNATKKTAGTPLAMTNSHTGLTGSGNTPVLLSNVYITCLSSSDCPKYSLRNGNGLATWHNFTSFTAPPVLTGIQGAKIFISAAVAPQPVDATGAPAYALPHDKDVASVALTVSVTTS